ncbi:MAG: hypothetical protein KAR87_05235 [Candidatus Aenigmarchaeota archaeon]|nr:hypothetical protein [Candidatus Aenigmarchaeota archaeon]
MNEKLTKSIKKSTRQMIDLLPIFIGIVFLIGLINKLIPTTAYTLIFTKNPFFDSIIGASLGSLLVGSPVISYILGGEFAGQGINLVAVTAFMIAWVTVGVIQFPAESTTLGKKFAFERNILSFAFSIISAIIIVSVVGVI